MRKVTPQQAVKGCLTRVALWFQGQRRTFTGAQVAEILIASWLGYEREREETAGRKNITGMLEMREK